MGYSAPKTDKPLAFSYVRMSTALQLQGDSLRRQTQNAKQYADANGLFLVEDFKLEDIGVSGYRGKNAEKGVLAVFLEAVKSGAIPRGSYLLVESLDRLSRDQPMKAFSTFSDILNAGLFIVTLLDGQLYSPENHDFMPLMTSILQMTLAHQESRKKSERLAQTWKQKRETIAQKKLTSKCPAWLRLSEDRTVYQKINEKVVIIKNIFDMALAGNGSYHIARELNSRGIKPLGRGSLWGKSSVTKILRNPAVFGEFQPHKMVSGKRVPEGNPESGYFPIVVTQREFMLVQAGRRKRETGGKGRKGNNVSNLFTNVARCQYCDSPMHYIDKGNGPRGGKYLKCSKSIRSRKCNPASWRYEHFEYSFLYYCRELDLADLALQSGKKRARAVAAENIDRSNAHLGALRVERERIFDLLQTASTEFVAQKLAEVEAKIAETEVNLLADKASLASIDENNPIDEAEIQEFIKTFESNTAINNVAQRRALRQKILASVEYLFLAPAGSAPSTARAFDLMLTNARDENDRQRMRAYQDQVSTLARVDAPYFRVGFSGDIHRVVCVEPGSPTKLRALVNHKDGVTTEFKGGMLSLGGVGEYTMEPARIPSPKAH